MSRLVARGCASAACRDARLRHQVHSHGARASVDFVSFLSSFTRIERAVTLFGLAPAALLGCGVHDAAVPARTCPRRRYQSFLPVPAPVPRAPAPRDAGRGDRQLAQRLRRARRHRGPQRRRRLGGRQRRRRPPHAAAERVEAVGGDDRARPDRQRPADARHAGDDPARGSDAVPPAGRVAGREGRGVRHQRPRPAEARDDAERQHRERQPAAHRRRAAGGARRSSRARSWATSASAPASGCSSRAPRA